MYIISKTKPESVDIKYLGLNDDNTTDYVEITFNENINQTSNGNYEYNKYSIIKSSQNINDLNDQDELNNLLNEAKEIESDNKSNIINNLKQSLNNSDYKVIKCAENYMLDSVLPYDYSKLLYDRMETRSKINKIQSNGLDEDNDLVEAKKNKIAEMNAVCQYTIINGIDFNDEHYSLNTHDQLNLFTLFTMASQGKKVPYHSDGNICRVYESEEMIELFSNVLSHVVYHTTYFNLLKAQINGYDDIDTIKSVEYGVELKEEYQNIIKEITSTN